MSSSQKIATIQLIGTGSSTGVPMIGCHCATCRSKNPKNKRLRSAARIQVDGTEILIDATPDFRQQALQYHIPFPNGLLLTHTHYDHVGGLEELRAYNIHSKKPIQCFLSRESHENVKKLLHYHFIPKSEEKSFSASFDFHIFDPPSGNFNVDGIDVEYFTYAQGTTSVTGFRIGTMAYVTDIKQYEPSLFSHLRDLDVLIISAAWRTPSRMQLTINEALEFSKKVCAKKTCFMHLSHDIEYRRETACLPQGVVLAYDGMEIDFSL